ncbi:4053_t:CDS:2, partial [Ambispora leptoticha]
MTEASNSNTSQIPTGFALPLPTQVELIGKPEKLHQHVLRCRDWPASEKTNYLQKVTSKELISRKRSNDHLDNEEDDSSTEQSVRDDDMQQPCQNTILSWCTRPLPQA